MHTAAPLATPPARVIVIETERLQLAHLQPADASFIVELLNDPDWLRYIGDRGVRSEADALAYIANGPGAMIARHGHGLYRVDRRSDGRALGICGLLKRDSLPDIDLGYAFLPAYRGQGYALEAAQACLQEARDRLRVPRVLAITTPANAASARVLLRLGMRLDRQQVFGGDTLDVYAIEFGSSGAA